jgi:sulfatase modifying factor 1
MSIRVPNREYDAAIDLPPPHSFPIRNIFLRCRARGLYGAAYAWGDELEPDGQRLAQYWEGDFPAVNRAKPGLERTARVRSYPGNGFGLYDLIGNVWEWTSDWYSAAPDRGMCCCGSPDREGRRIEESADPAMPIAMPRRVLKGGSHLCAVND